MDTSPVANWTPLRDALTAVENSVTFAWADLDSLVGGLPRSAYAYSAFWKGARSGWPGFTTVNVRIGDEVTFVRDGAALSAPVDRSSIHPQPALDVATDLILIACVKQKLAHPAPARDLYTSDLFRKGREYAERAGVPWFVSSAKHGLVAPDQELEPYELHLAKTSAAYRDSWGARVLEQLESAASPLHGRVIEVHAGAAHADAIRDRLGRAGAQISEPLAGCDSRGVWRGTEPSSRLLCPKATSPALVVPMRGASSRL